MVARSSGETRPGCPFDRGIRVRPAARFNLVHVYCRGALDGVHHHQFLQHRLVPNRQNFLQLGFAGQENDPSARVAQDIRRLFGSERGVNRDCDGAKQQGSEIGNRPLRPILAQNGNPVTPPDAPLPQSAGGRHNPVAQCVRRNRTPFLPQPLQHDFRMPALYHSKVDVVKCAQGHQQEKKTAGAP